MFAAYYAIPLSVMLLPLRALGTLLLVCLLATASHAQLLWQTTMGTAARETSAGFVAVPGGYVSVGQGGYNGGSTRGNQFFLSKLDAAGTVLWQKSTSFAGRNASIIEALGAAATATGEVYATGQCFSTGSTTSFGLLVKFNASGDTLWSRVLRGTNQAAYTKIVTTTDGGAVVIGANDADQFVAKFSAAGQELWHRTYPYSASYIGYLENIVQLATGNFLVTNSPNYGGVAWKYLLLDSQGLLLTQKPARAYGSYYTQTDLAGNVLVGAGRFFKISPQGDTLWSRQYTQFGRKVEARLAVPTPSGQYLLAGTRTNSLDEDLSILLVDQNGTRLRDTLLVRYGGNEYPTGAYVDAQGNYIIGGYTDDNGPFGRADQFALKLRNWNRLLPTRPANTTTTAYHIFPNPATSTNRLRVTADTGSPFTGAYELRDLTGRVVQAGNSWPAQGLPVGELLTSLYLLRLREGERWLPALRLVVR